MPRTANKSGNTFSDRRTERTIRVENPSWWESVKQFFQARETRMVLGILLLAFSVIAILAYVSYLFTGTYDQSVLSMNHADRVANRETVRNLLGLPGAHLAHFLIDGSFGFVSILMVGLFGVYGLRLMHVFKDIKAIKWFCCCTFWLLWGSVVWALPNR